MSASPQPSHLFFIVADDHPMVREALSLALHNTFPTPLSRRRPASRKPAPPLPRSPKPTW
jgi:hypothetical protein